MSTTTTAVQKSTAEKFVEFVPFGAQDIIKLSVAMVKNLIAVKTKSGKTCSDNDAIKFIAMCQARRLNPFEGDAWLIGYDTKDGGAVFSLITAHQAFLKRAELHPEFDGFKSGIIIERNGEVMDVEGDFYMNDDKVLGGWAIVFFKNRKQPMHKRLRLKRFKKPFGIWMEDDAGMICKCAEADALRSSFPTMLGGLYLKEEVDVTAPVARAVSTPIFESKVIQEAPKTPQDDSGGIQTPPEPQTPAQASPAQPAGPLAGIRDEIKKAGVSEQQLIGFLIDIGQADNDATSLEAVALGNPSSIEMVTNQLGDIIERIKS